MDDSFHLKKENPRERASFISKLCFLWTANCIWKCNKNEMKLEDIYKCPESYSSNQIGNYLDEKWIEELRTCRKKELKPSFLGIIIKTFYPDYIPLAVTAFLNYVVIKGLQPFILSNLIRLFINKKYTAIEMLSYGGSLCFLMLVSSFLLHYNVCGSNLLGMKIRIAVSSLVYRKVLKLNQHSLSKTSSGQVINLLSNDVVRFEMAIRAMHFLWITPIQLTVIIFVIWSLFDLGALVGIATLIVFMIPLQGILGHLTGVYRIKAAEKTDSRVKLTNEILSGMAVIKMYTWEKPFEKVVQKIRREELKYIRASSYIKGILACIMFVTEKLGLCVTVIFYSLLGYPVSTDVVFSVSVCFRILQFSLGTMLPSAVIIGSEVLVSVRRLEDFLMLEEIHPVAHNAPAVAEVGIVQLKLLSAHWKEKVIALDNVSMSISKGSVCAVVGPVGSGKSTLLMLMLREIQISNGTFTIRGITSFSAQKPWLFSSTIRKNIIFGQDYNESRYKRVLEVCGLTQDIEQFQDGDQTIVGSRGVSLSGGQRARINLARAVYKEADIYLLDDVLSALDSKIGKYVFQECILKFLSGKTRVLVTHQLHYLKEVEHIVILKKGSIENQGPFTEIFEENLEPYLLESKIEENNDRKKSFNEKNVQLVMQKTSCSEENNPSIIDIDDVNNSKDWVILKYIHFSGGSLNMIFLFVLLLISQLSLNLSDYWITFWSEEEYIRYSYKPTTSSNYSISNKTVVMDIKNFFLRPDNESIFSQWTETIFVDLHQYTLIKPSIMRTIYIIIILLAITFMLCRSSLFFYLCTRASQELHSKMFSSILETPMMFFYTTPLGNTLNRLSKDMGAADEQFPKTLLNFLASLPVIFGSMLLIVISNSLMILLIIPLLLILIKIRKWFLTTIIILRRYETAVKSPIFSFVASSMDGVTTIRSNKCEELLIPQFDRHQDLHSATSYMAISCTSSFGLWIDLLCVSFVCFIVLFFIILDRYIYISGSFIGLAIFHSMTMVGLFQSCIRTMSEVVNYLTNIERIVDYTQLKKEDTIKLNDGIVSRLWPSRGDIEFKNLSLRYVGEDRSILENINVKIYDSEKIGIVGRTGAGKSSLIAALFLLSPIEGDIFIDDVNIQDIELKKLRKEIAIIPQDPVLFSASVRFNLDPEFLYPDERIWKILAEVELEKIIPSLDFQITGGGDNMSLGQRQLLCMARAMLRENKILILDEATANIDMKTDELIQKTIRRKFHNVTVLTVAHRLNSVMASDRVLVLDRGKVVEFDQPFILMQKKNGYFRKLAEEAGHDIASDSNEIFSSRDLIKQRS